jgi:hypothetical protein
MKTLDEPRHAGPIGDEWLSVLSDDVLDGVTCGRPIAASDLTGLGATERAAAMLSMLALGGAMRLASDRRIT